MGRRGLPYGNNQNNQQGKDFLLTEKEFDLVESQYSKISQRMEKALGYSFVQENIQFSDPNIDSTYLAKAFAECVSSLMTAQMK